MTRPMKSPDRILASVEEYDSPRAKLLRVLKRWDGTATSCELVEACGVRDDARERNTYQAALGRLVASGHVTRTKIDARTRRYAGGFVDGIAQYEYRLAKVKPAPRLRRPPRCSECGEPGHYVRTCLVRWARSRAA